MTSEAMTDQKSMSLKLMMDSVETFGWVRVLEDLLKRAEAAEAALRDAQKMACAEGAMNTTSFIEKHLKQAPAEPTREGDAQELDCPTCGCPHNEFKESGHCDVPYCPFGKQAPEGAGDAQESECSECKRPRSAGCHLYTSCPFAQEGAGGHDQPYAGQPSLYDGDLNFSGEPAQDSGGLYSTQRLTREPSGKVTWIVAREDGGLMGEQVCECDDEATADRIVSALQSAQDHDEIRRHRRISSKLDAQLIKSAQEVERLREALEKIGDLIDEDGPEFAPRARVVVQAALRTGGDHG